MKFNEHGGFDGLDENIRTYSAAANGDDPADGYGGNSPFDDDEEEEEVVVAMTSDDDEDLDHLEDEVDDLLRGASHIEAAIIVAAPPSPAAGYTPAVTLSKVPEKSAAPPAPKKAAKKAAPAKKAPAKKVPAKQAKKAKKKVGD